MRSKSPLDQLNVALAGLEAAVDVMEHLGEKPMPRSLVEQMRHHTDTARQHLTTIQFSLNQIVRGQ